MPPQMARLPDFELYLVRLHWAEKFEMQQFAICSGRDLKETRPYVAMCLTICCKRFIEDRDHESWQSVCWLQEPQQSTYTARMLGSSIASREKWHLFCSALPLMKQHPMAQQLQDATADGEV